MMLAYYPAVSCYQFADNCLLASNVQPLPKAEKSAIISNLQFSVFWLNIVSLFFVLIL